MRVFNLMTSPLNYRGREIPGNGGFLEYPDITFIPTRDKRLAALKVLAFGALPAWWVANKAARTKKVEAPPVVVPRAIKFVAKEEPKVEIKPEVVVEMKDGEMGESPFGEKQFSRKMR